MLISSEMAGSAVDSSGATLVTTDVVYSADFPGQVLGPFGSESTQYEGYGTDGSPGASWSPLGEFPADAGVLLTHEELSIVYPDKTSVAGVSLWAKYPRVHRPSDDLGDADDAVRLSWVPDPTPFLVRGLFGESSTTYNKVKLHRGGVWVLTANSVTLLDYTRDTATLYTNDKGSVAYGVLNPGSSPDYPFSDPRADLAVPLYPYTSLDVYGSRCCSYVAICGLNGVSILRKDFRISGSVYEVVDTHYLGFTVTDVAFMPDGSLLAVGRDTDPFDSAAGVLKWSVRAPVGDDVFSAVAWFEPQSGPPGVTTLSASIALGADGYVWVCCDRVVFRMRDTVDGLSSDTTLELRAGIRGDDTGVEPRYSSLDKCSFLVGMVVGEDYVAVLANLDTTTQNGGSMLTVYDKRLKQALYRRRYKEAALQVTAGKSTDVRSRRVAPGVTLSPPSGYGPDQAGQ